MTTELAVEFVILMLIVAAIIAVLAERLRIPYTVALVLGGLALGSVPLPIVESLIRQGPHWLTPDVMLVVFLPPLLFEGSLKIQISHLRQSLTPILALATLGVVVTTVVTGLTVHAAMGLPLLVALVFGAMVAATDPISVLAIFKDGRCPSGSRPSSRARACSTTAPPRCCSESWWPRFQPAT